MQGKCTRVGLLDCVVRLGTPENGVESVRLESICDKTTASRRRLYRIEHSNFPPSNPVRRNGNQMERAKSWFRCRHQGCSRARSMSYVYHMHSLSSKCGTPSSGHIRLHRRILLRRKERRVRDRTQAMIDQWRERSSDSCLGGTSGHLNMGIGPTTVRHFTANPTMQKICVSLIESSNRLASTLEPSTSTFRNLARPVPSRHGLRVTSKPRIALANLETPRRELLLTSRSLGLTLVEIHSGSECRTPQPSNNKDFLFSWLRVSTSKSTVESAAPPPPRLS